MIVIPNTKEEMIKIILKKNNILEDYLIIILNQMKIFTLIALQNTLIVMHVKKAQKVNAILVVMTLFHRKVKERYAMINQLIL